MAIVKKSLGEWGGLIKAKFGERVYNQYVNNVKAWKRTMDKVTPTIMGWFIFDRTPEWEDFWFDVDKKLLKAVGSSTDEIWDLVMKDVSLDDLLEVVKEMEVTKAMKEEEEEGVPEGFGICTECGRNCEYFEFDDCEEDDEEIDGYDPAEEELVEAKEPEFKLDRKDILAMINEVPEARRATRSFMKDHDMTLTEFLDVMQNMDRKKFNLFKAVLWLSKK